MSEKQDDIQQDITETEDVATVETSPEVEPQHDLRAELKRWIETFGANGAEWFAANKNWEECRDLQVAELNKVIQEQEQTISDLQVKLHSALLAVGESEPITPSAGEIEEEPRRNGLASRITLGRN